MTNEIIPFDNCAVKGAFDIPDRPNKLTQKTTQAIINAWNNFTVLDKSGRICINSEGVHVVLRTSTPSDTI